MLLPFLAVVVNLCAIPLSKVLSVLMSCSTNYHETRTCIYSCIYFRTFIQVFICVPFSLIPRLRHAFDPLVVKMHGWYKDMGDGFSAEVDSGGDASEAVRT